MQPATRALLLCYQWESRKSHEEYKVTVLITYLPLLFFSRFILGFNTGVSPVISS
jgi:hypothetical protein